MRHGANAATTGSADGKSAGLQLFGADAEGLTQAAVVALNTEAAHGADGASVGGRGGVGGHLGRFDLLLLGCWV